MTKIAYIISSNNLGGAELCFNALDSRREYDNCIIYKYSFVWKGYSLVSFLRALNAFKLLIVEENIEVVVSSLWRAHLLSLCTSKIKMRVPFFHSSSYRSVIDRYISECIKLTADKGILVDSISTRLFHERTYKGVSLPVSMKLTDKNDYIKSYDSFTKMSRFVYVGRLDKIKNIDEIITTLEIFAEKSQLVVSIDLFGPRAKNFDLPESEKVFINYRGTVENGEVNKVVQGYDGFISLSKVEGYAMAARDALHMGMICVLTPVGDLEFLLLHKVNCLIHSSPEKTALNLFNLSGEEALLMSKNARLVDGDSNFVESFYNNLNQLFKDE